MGAEQVLAFKSQIPVRRLPRELGDAAAKARECGPTAAAPKAKAPRPKAKRLGGVVTTCDSAREASKAVGVRVMWRPDGAVDRFYPGADTALVMED